MTTRLSSTLWALVALPLLAGCYDEDLVRPRIPPGGAIFQRYVALGNSITAGFQSLGINDSTQKLAYPALLARQMGTSFFHPSLQRPGCPAPYTNVLTGARVSGASALDCALRTRPLPPVLNNLGVPSAGVLDALDNLGPGTAANALTQFILGGRTQVQMMERVQPTFVTVWLGNNPTLGAALAGDTSTVQSLATFQTSYTTLLDAIEAAGAEAALAPVVKVTNAPNFTQGQVFLAVRATMSASAQARFVIDASCAPSALGGVGDSVYVPFSNTAVLMGTHTLGGTINVNCGAGTTTPAGPVLSKPEFRMLAQRIAAYNTFIQGEATQRGFAFADMNALLDSLRAATTTANPLIRSFPDFTKPTTTIFGTMLSLDGVHPSSLAHKLIANKFIAAINVTYGTALRRMP